MKYGFPDTSTTRFLHQRVLCFEFEYHLSPSWKLLFHLKLVFYEESMDNIEQAQGLSLGSQWVPIHSLALLSVLPLASLTPSDLFAGEESGQRGSHPGPQSAVPDPHLADGGGATCSQSWNRENTQRSSEEQQASTCPQAAALDCCEQAGSGPDLCFRASMSSGSRALPDTLEVYSHYPTP